jgi:hypothetical protein
MGKDGKRHKTEHGQNNKEREKTENDIGQNRDKTIKKGKIRKTT